MIFLKILMLAAVGSIIGWMTNLIAVKLLFRPFDPVSIPILNIKVQGLIPKRKEQIAATIGQTIERDLLSLDEIINEFIDVCDQKELFSIVKKKIIRVVDERLPGIVPSAFKGMINEYIEKIVDEEGYNIIEDIKNNVIKKGNANIEIAKLIEDKINDFPMDKLEAIVLNIAKKELAHIEILGAVLGFVIGLFQGLIIIL